MATVYKRGKLWWIRFQWRGKEIRKPAKTTSKADAQALLTDTRREYRRLDVGGKPRTKFEDAMVRFDNDYMPSLRQSSARRYTSSLSVLLDHFEGKYLDEINAASISRFLAGRKVKDATKRRDLACLSSLFKRAIGWEMVERNPVVAFDKKGLGDSEQRMVFLDRKEFAKLHAGLPNWLKPIAAIAVGTGMRLGEILALRRADIGDSIAIRDSKTGEPRRVPLTPYVSAQFPAQSGKATEQIFPYRVDAVSRAFRKAADDVGFEHVRFHDLRHTFASWAVQAGFDLYRVGKVLGHKGPQMTQRYAHLRTEDVQGLMDAVGTKLGTEPRHFKAKTSGKSKRKRLK